MSATKAKPKTARETETVHFANSRQWDEWLERHHSSSEGVWLKLAKKAPDTAPLTYAQAVEVALTWGWVDGQKKALDGKFWLQKFTPRRARSLWSKINRGKALALIAAGKMKPAGLAEVNRAKKDGRWKAAYDSPSRAAVPEDLAAALSENPRAAAFFLTLDATNRYAVLFRVQAPKKAETRARRIAEFVKMLAKHQKIHP